MVNCVGVNGDFCFAGIIISRAEIFGRIKVYAIKFGRLASELEAFCA